MSFFSNKGVLAGLALGGAGLQTFSTLRGSRAQSKALEADARIVQQQGYRDEEAQRRGARRLLGAQAASFAQAGGGGDAGVMRQSAVEAELDALNIRYGSQLKAHGLRRAASDVKRQGRYLAGAQALSGLATYGLLR